MKKAILALFLLCLNTTLVLAAQAKGGTWDINAFTEQAITASSGKGGTYDVNIVLPDEPTATGKGGTYDMNLGYYFPVVPAPTQVTSLGAPLNPTKGGGGQNPLSIVGLAPTIGIELNTDKNSLGKTIVNAGILTGTVDVAQLVTLMSTMAGIGFYVLTRKVS